MLPILAVLTFLLLTEAFPLDKGLNQIGQHRYYDYDAFPTPPPGKYLVTRRILQDPELGLDDIRLIAPHLRPPKVEIVNGRWFAPDEDLELDRYGKRPRHPLLRFSESSSIGNQRKWHPLLRLRKFHKDGYVPDEKVVRVRIPKRKYRIKDGEIVPLTRP
ncbi:unnamed protein product [Cylicocyclus nassatus]|uniref:Uncharacterized protein n=1 Tax=Cylicocyclus nassatus TaxID=53992 RepID=A0AA36DME0_CYLNA|nr:unnamed protein product [Cylicocyclus nassatus]